MSETVELFVSFYFSCSLADSAEGRITKNSVIVQRDGITYRLPKAPILAGDSVIRGSYVFERYDLKDRASEIRQAQEWMD